MLKPVKRLGQHFLQDPNTIRKIVDSLAAGADDPVVEIGPGTGALTRILHQKYDAFIAIEVDQRAVKLLATEIPGLDVRHQDIKEVNWSELASAHGAPLSVIGNLPYYLTSEILIGLLDAGAAIRESVLMMQYEVAQRLVAARGTKAYGILSVYTQLRADPTLLFPVSPHVFFPKPDVRSAVVRLTTAENGPSDEVWALTRRVVRMAFNQRRKTLRNSLSAIAAETDRAVPEEWRGKRAEELAPNDFVAVANYFFGP